MKRTLRSNFERGTSRWAVRSPQDKGCLSIYQRVVQPLPKGAGLLE